MTTGECLVSECIDSNPCTENICTPADTCGGNNRVVPCAVDDGFGICSGGSCGVLACAPGFEDADGVDANGCEAVCPTCGAAGCAGVEIADDGIDSNCDGFELFGPHDSLMSLSQPLPPSGAFNINAIGEFDTGAFGTIVAGGPMGKPNPSSPVVFCVSGIVDKAVGPVDFHEVEVEVCRGADGKYAGTWTGPITAFGHETTTSGLFDADDTLFSVTFDSLPLAPGMELTDATFLLDGGAMATLSAVATIGTEPEPLVADVSGTIAASGDVSLTLVQDSASTWRPLPAASWTVADAEGTLDLVDEEWSVSVQAELGTIGVAPGLVLDGALLDAFADSTGAWQVGLAGGTTVGPFDGVLAGTLSQASAADPIEGCLTGSVASSLSSLPLSGVSVEACWGGAGLPVVSVSGDVDFNGSVQPFSGTLLPGVDWELSLDLGDASIAAPFLEFENTILVVSADLSIDLTATLSVAGGELSLGISGGFSLDGDLSLSASPFPGGSWSPLPPLDLAFSGLSGTLNRTEGDWSLELPVLGGSGALDLGVDLSGINATIEVGASQLEVAIAAGLDVGPFGLPVTGTFTRPAGGPVTGCLSGQFSGPLAGLPLSDVSVSVCRTATELTVSLAGTVGFEGSDTSFTGHVVLGPSWLVVITLEDVGLASGLELSTAELTIPESLDPLTLTGTLVAGTAPANQLTLDIDGTYEASGALSFSVEQPDGETWKPFGTNNLLVTAVAGTLDRANNGDWSVAVAGAISSFVIIPGVQVTEATAGGSLDSGGAWSVSVTGEIDLGPFADVSVAGVVSQAGPGQPVQGCLSGSASATVAGVPVVLPTVEICAGDDTTIELEAELTLFGNVVVALGELDLGAAVPTMTFALPSLELAPGLTLMDVELVFGGGEVSLSGRLDLGAGGNPLPLQLSGVFEPGGDWSFSVDIAPGEVWIPFPGLGIELGSLPGTISSVDGDLSASLSVGGLGTLQLLPGLTVTSLGLDVLWTPGNLVPSLTGSLLLGVGQASVTLDCSISVLGGGSFAVQGAFGASIKPFGGVGIGAFTIDGGSASIQVDGPSGTADISVSGSATACLVPTCSASELTEFQVSGGFTFGQTQAIWFSGQASNVPIPVFGTIETMTIAVASGTLIDVDIFGTPFNPDDDVDLESGISLFALTAAPPPIDSVVPSALFQFSVGPISVSVTALLDVEWELIQPGDNFPGVTAATLEQLELSGTISGLVAEFSIAAEATLVPADGSPPMTGLGSVTFGLLPAGATFEVELAMNGRWYDPFGLEPFAIQNPGMALGMLVTAGPPVPNTLGFTGDFFWLKSGSSWPSLAQWPIPTTGTAPPPPDGVTQLGGTAYVDLTPTPSGVCILGTCVPLPTFIARMDINDLSFPVDVVSMLNDVASSALPFMPDLVPNVSIPSFIFPLGADVDQFSVYASTHNREVFGLDYRAGFRLDLDLDILGAIVGLTGLLDTGGLYLEGRLEPLNLFGLDILEIVGDPYRQVASMGSTGFIEVPTALRLDLNDGAHTVEAWVRDTGFSLAEFDDVIAEKYNLTTGYRFGVGSADEFGGKPRARFYAGGQTREYVATTGCVKANAWNHVAFTFDDEDMAIFCNGVRVDVTTVSNEFDGPPGTNLLELEMGRGFTRFDDVRFWDVIRTPAEIEGESLFLTSGAGGSSAAYASDPDLIARWEIDFDEGGEDDVYNSRVWEGGSKLHGTYESGAQAVVKSADQDIYVKLALRVPGAKGSEDGPGMWMQAGAKLDIPFLGDISAAAQFQLATDGIFGSFYAREIQLLPTALGEFYVGGDGPNFVEDDFDDGLYAFLDVLDVSFGATAAVGFRTNAGVDVVGGDGSVLFACPAGVSCSGPQDHELAVDASVDFEIPLPGISSLLGLDGDFEALLNSPNWFISLDGALTFFGKEFISASFTIDADSIEFSSMVSFGQVTVFGEEINLGALQMSMSFDWSDLTLCGSGSYTQNQDNQNPDAFTCGVSLCVGPTELSPSLGCGDFCIGPGFCPDDEICLFALCKPKQPNGAVCGKDNHCQSDNCGCIFDDLLSGLSSGICYEPSSVEIGGTCQVDAECTTGRCSAELCVPGECVCDVDSHCGPNEYCDQGTILGIGKNECKPQKPDGAVCAADNRCLSDNCSEPPVLGFVDACQFCYTPDSKELGESCTVDAECETDRCGSVCGTPGVCKCNADSDCDNDEYCDTGFFGSKTCKPQKADCEGCSKDKVCIHECSGIFGQCYEPNSRDEGDDCCVDDQCSTGKCTSGECRCTKDSDCPGTFGHCYKPVLGSNFCGVKKNNGAGCDTDSECKSDECGGCVDDIFGANLGWCYEPNSKDYGDTCYADNECKSDKCSGICGQGTCKCNDDGDCDDPADEYCSTGGNCYEEKGDHEFCGTNDASCKSGRCSCEPGGVCTDGGDTRGVGSSCVKDDECASEWCGGSCGLGFPIFGECKALKDDCETCDADHKCKSGYCSSWILGTCYTPNSKNLGQSCCKNAQCKSDKCESSECVCKDDSDCAGSKKCKTPIFGQNYCK